MNAKKWSEQKQNFQALKNQQEPPESPPEPPGTDAGRPGVDFPPVFIQIHGNLTDFKPKNLGGQKVLRLPYDKPKTKT